MKIHHKTDYRQARKSAYPDIGDQLDAVLALASHLRQNGYALPEQTLRWIDACLDVKKRFQKG